MPIKKYCEYLKGNKCACKEPNVCDFEKLIDCPATTKIKIKRKKRIKEYYRNHLDCSYHESGFCEYYGNDCMEHLTCNGIEKE